MLLQPSLKVLDPNGQVRLLVEEGAPVLIGPAACSSWRVRRAALVARGAHRHSNLAMRLSGIATGHRSPGGGHWRTRGCAWPTPAKPPQGLRLLEKYAVRCGGGVNHRTRPR